MNNPNKSFREVELETWTGLAAEYDEQFSSIPRQAIGPVLYSLRPISGRRLLDIACGTGHLVAAAVERGAFCEGIDIAETMVAKARKNYPQARFKVGDAAKLPYKDDMFDAVCCTFGLSHMEDPATVFAEVLRVLKSGGRFTFTLWYGPDDGNEAQAIMKEAIALYAINPIELPETWIQLRYANKAACREMTVKAGFKFHSFQRLPIVWGIESEAEVVGLFEKFSMRTRVILDDQAPDVKRKILDFTQRKVKNLLTNGRTTLDWPALLTIVRKPDRTGETQHATA